MSTLDKSNAFRRLVIAYTCGSLDYRSKMLKYVVNKDSEGNFLEIAKSKKWKQWSVESEDIANDIFIAVFGEKKWFE
jgi:hypothetical protein